MSPSLIGKNIVNTPVEDQVEKLALHMEDLGARLDQVEGDLVAVSKTSLDYLDILPLSRYMNKHYLD